MILLTLACTKGSSYNSKLLSVSQVSSIRLLKIMQFNAQNKSAFLKGEFLQGVNCKPDVQFMI